MTKQSITLPYSLFFSSGLWAAGHMRNPGMLVAAFPLVEGLLHTND